MDQYYWYLLLEFCFIFVVFIVRKKSWSVCLHCSSGFLILKWKLLAAYVLPTLCSHIPAFQPSILTWPYESLLKRWVRWTNWKFSNGHRKP